MSMCLRMEPAKILAAHVGWGRHFQLTKVVRTDPITHSGGDQFNSTIASPTSNSPMNRSLLIDIRADKRQSGESYHTTAALLNLPESKSRNEDRSRSPTLHETKHPNPDEIPRESPKPNRLDYRAIPWRRTQHESSTPIVGNAPHRREVSCLPPDLVIIIKRGRTNLGNMEVSISV